MFCWRRQVLGGFCEKLTPAMCLIYVVGVLGVIIINLEHVPAAFAGDFPLCVCTHARCGRFGGLHSCAGAAAGAARGTFSNEAGCGSSPITHATAITDHPFKEGMYGCFEVFVDTLVVCTMTALGILCAGPEIWQSGLEAEALTMAAFSTAYGARSASSWSPFLWRCSHSPLWWGGRSIMNPRLLFVSQGKAVQGVQVRHPHPVAGSRFPGSGEDSPR